MADAISEWLQKNGEPVTREAWIDLNWLGEPPEPWTAEDEAQLPEELQLKPEATRDAQVYLHVHQGDAWEEREHPRKARGPGGGEFTVKGSGSFGGGPTIHVHTERPTPITAQEAQAAREQWTREMAPRYATEARYQGVGDKPFTGPHAAENADRTGRLILSAESRHAVEAAVRDAGLTLVDAAELPPNVVRAFGIAHYDDGSAKSATWFDTNMAAASGLFAAKSVVMGHGFARLGHELESNVKVSFAPMGYGGFYAAVWMDKATGQQWLIYNSDVDDYRDWRAEGSPPNTVAAQTSARDLDGGAPLASAAADYHRQQFVHEMGHILDNMTGRKMSAALGRAVKMAVGGEIGVDKSANDWARVALSEYGANNEREAAAEAWVKAVEAPKTLPLALRKWAKAARSAAGENVVAEFAG
jgi:hypothetical protein